MTQVIYKEGFILKKLEKKNSEDISYPAGLRVSMVLKISKITFRRLLAVDNRVY